MISSMEEVLYIIAPSPGGNLVTGNDSVIPENYELNQYYPNPFNPTTQIQYELPRAGEIDLTLYNMLGMEVMKLDRGIKPAGIHQISFDGSHLPSGIYFYQLRSGNCVKTRKMSLLK